MFFKKKQKPFSWDKAFIVIGSVFLVAFIGGLMTDIGSWYNQLPKIALQPPRWVFGPVWTLLYILTGWSALTLWETPKADEKKLRATLFTFIANGILNVLWSFIFFTMKDVSKAFMEITVLWFSIVVMIVLAKSINKKAAWMLVPYLLWVSFATFLNLSFVLAMN
ncbi:MAG: TspO/MBR family protein [Candidatus Gracilibacteria bacterium]